MKPSAGRAPVQKGALGQSVGSEAHTKGNCEEKDILGHRILRKLVNETTSLKCEANVAKARNAGVQRGDGAFLIWKPEGRQRWGIIIPNLQYIDFQ